ncbi:hypothetical protein SARC_04991 [Sphaeroforma arctica JP610]|uniref:CCHC-type domain-containing protein n=1 Tax=Sphaeroforma arctica JP610 TaxID=667725 RepID=A0A0L0G0Z7_9EUKA|nr:hypothetical protein SARC_04991 [Sphaeroforma arctica JP610]KNC82750.1 hypothetical protein SARC_04991 [Sphaeroforma arctica JP610]|eukprot:XP_014156652.1 hypothetical protein SARC_04991 [Sphaeroforma arctica JP610]
MGLMRTEPVYGKTVMASLRVVHDSIDVFFERLYANNVRLGVLLRQNYKYTGLTQVIVYLRQERIHAAGPSLRGGQAVKEELQGDRYAMDGTLAALGDLRAQLNNQRKENKVSQKDLRKRIDESKRQRGAPGEKPKQKRTRYEASEEEEEVELSGGEPGEAFKAGMRRIKCFKCHKQGHIAANCRNEGK